jgi:hypothetical protein
MGATDSIIRTDWDTSTNRDILKLGLRKLFDNTQREAVVEYPIVVNDLTTKEYYERDQQIAGLGLAEAVREGQNVPIQAPPFGASVSYTQSGFGTGFRITHMMDYFNKYKLLNRWTSDLGKVMKETKDIEVAKLFNNPTVSTYGGTGFDTQVLAYATHTGLASGTDDNYSNYADAGLSITALEDMRYYFSTLVDDLGMYMGAKPTILAIEPTLYFTAKEILGSEGKAHEMSNTINVLKELNLSIFEYHRLTSTTSWFVEAKSDKNFDINVMTSMNPTFWTKDAPDMTKDTIVFSLQYFTYGFGDPRTYYCGNT